MRVLQVTEFFPPVRGGLEFHVDALAAELSRRGHEIHVATLTRHPQPSQPDVTVHTVPSSRLIPRQDENRPYHPPVPVPATHRALRDLVRELAPDVVHAHNLLAASLPAGRDRPPLVYTAHDYSQVCQLRTLMRYDREICAGPAARKCLNCGTRTHGVVRASLLTPSTVIGRHRLHPSRILAVSDAVAMALEGKFDCPIDVVPNFLAPVSSAGRSAADELQSPYFLYAGDPGWHKGVDLLLEMWRQTPPAASLVMAMTRPGPPRDLPAGVTIKHWDRPSLLDAMRGSVAVLAPSLWADPCPSVAIEAISTGTPVIATNVGGFPSIVTDGAEGLLVPPNDLGALANAVNRILQDPGLRRRLSEASLARAKDFQVASIAERVEQAYLSVITA